ncbi:TPA: hypothetical protein ACF24H_004494 [Klebsiella pneumoniae]|nr:hypothetical protein [Klebsiella pneumoniae]
MSFSINRTVTVTRTTDSGILLSPESVEISLTFKVSSLLTIFGPGETAGNTSAGTSTKTAVVMVSADGGETYQFYENINIEDTSVISQEEAEEYLRKTDQYQ